MDRSATVNHDHLQQYMVDVNSLDLNYIARWQSVLEYKLKRCSNKECCKQCRYVMFKGTMTKWPVQKLAQGTTQKLLQHIIYKLCILAFHHFSLHLAYRFCKASGRTAVTLHSQCLQRRKAKQTQMHILFRNMLRNYSLYMWHAAFKI